jgi:hypothetical protein
VAEQVVPLGDELLHAARGIEPRVVPTDIFFQFVPAMRTAELPLAWDRGLMKARMSASMPRDLRSHHGLRSVVLETVISPDVPKAVDVSPTSAVSLARSSPK